MTATPDSLLARYPGAQAFRFGDGPELCGALLELVRSGTKTATCGRLSDFSLGGTDRPVPGRRHIATLWDGTPAVVIETVEVTERRFRDMDAAFALA